MSSAGSRLISISNNAALQNFIQRHLLRPSASAASSASVIQLLNTLSEPQLSSQCYTEDPKPYFNTLPVVQKPWCNPAEIMKYSSDSAGGHFPLGMFGLSGVDQSGISKIHTIRTDLSEDSNDADGDLDDPEIDAFDEDDYEDEDDDDEDYDDDDLDENQRSS